MIFGKNSLPTLSDRLTGMAKDFKISLMFSSAAMKAIVAGVKIVSKWVRIDEGGCLYIFVHICTYMYNYFSPCTHTQFHQHRSSNPTWLPLEEPWK